MQAATNRRDELFLARRLLLAVALAGAGCVFQLTAADLGAGELPVPSNALFQSGWVLADLNGDQNVDLATARSGRHDANGYAQEVRVTLGAFQQTAFRFLSPGATIELSSQDVDGDDDGDLVVFQPLSSQPIGVWLNDGAGSFHEGRLADFRKLWSDRPGSALRGHLQQLPLFAISEERTQSLAPAAATAAPENIVTGCGWWNEAARQCAGRSDCRPRAPPSNS